MVSKNQLLQRQVKIQTIPNSGLTLGVGDFCLYLQWKPMSLINVEYISQLDNEFNPTGSCNVTSMVMAATRRGQKGGLPLTTKGDRSSDSLYQFCGNNGYSRHSPYDLSAGFNAWRKKNYPNLGIHSVCTTDTTWEDIFKSLESGFPVVIHGYFTGFGHIIVIKGWDKERKQFIVNDPYGEWNNWGYNSSVSGEDLRYSFNMMERLCGPSGTMWCHSVQVETKEPSPFPQIEPRYRGEKSGTQLQHVFSQELIIPLEVIVSYPSLVWQIQIRLSTIGFDPGKSDSVWGQKTEKAYCDFCNHFSLAPFPLAKPIAKKLIEAKPVK